MLNGPDPLGSSALFETSSFLTITWLTLGLSVSFTLMDLYASMLFHTNHIKILRFYCKTKHSTYSRIACKYLPIRKFKVVIGGLNAVWGGGPFHISSLELARFGYIIWSAALYNEWTGRSWCLHTKKIFIVKLLDASTPENIGTKMMPTINLLSGLFTTAATVSASGVRRDMEEIFKVSSSSSSLCSRTPLNRSLMTAELMDWSTFISVSLAPFSLLDSSTEGPTILRGLDVEAGGETINSWPVIQQKPRKIAG